MGGTPFPRRPSPRRGAEPERRETAARRREPVWTLQEFVTHDNFPLQEIVMGDKFLQSAMML